MKNRLYKGRFLLIPIAITAFLSLISFVVMQLWNLLLPEILNVSSINFWQAMGIFILCKILFGFGKGGRMNAPWMRDKCKSMTIQDREKFKEQMKARMCGGWNRNTEKNDSGEPHNN